MRIDVDLAAFSAFDDEAVGIMVGHIDKELGLAGAAAIGLVALAGFYR